MNKKRGQVTVFIIIALVILIGAGVWFALSNELGTDPIFVPEDARPVYEYTVSCLEDATDAALTTISITGGYTDIPSFIAQNPSAYLHVSPIPELKQPYWWYEGITQVPTLAFIGEQLEQSIEKDFSACIKNYTSLQPQFTVDIEQKPRVNVEFGDQRTRILVDMPIQVLFTADNSQSSIDEFLYDTPIRIKAIHELASNLVSSQREDFFIEHKMIDLLTLDPEEVPVTELGFDCTRKTWRVDDVRQRWVDLIAQNVGYIKIAGTDYSDQTYVNNPFGEDTYEASYFNTHYIWRLDNPPQEGLKAGITVDPAWPIGFAVRPSSDGTLTGNPTAGSDLLENFCINIYHYTYDLVVPVKITVVDTPENGDPYAFSYVMQARVDHNQPSTINRGVEVFETVERLSAVDYCDQAKHETTIYTINNETGEDISDVDLTFTCGRYTCDVGTTDWINFGAAAGATLDLPKCTNGILRASKKGFQDVERFIVVDESDSSHVVFLHPVTQLTFDVVKHPLSDLTKTQLLGLDQTVQIELIDTQSSFITTHTYPSSTEKELGLRQGSETYKVTLRLIENDAIIGGYQANWTVDQDRLKRSQHVRFHIIEDDNRAQDYTDITDFSKFQVPTPQLRETS